MIKNKAFPGGSAVKNQGASTEMRVRSLDWEDPLEKEMATHSSILTWRIPWTEDWWVIAYGVAESDTTA